MSTHYKDVILDNFYIAPREVTRSRSDRQIDQEFEEEKQRQATLERLGREIDMDKLLGPD